MGGNYVGLGMVSTHKLFLKTERCVETSIHTFGHTDRQTDRQTDGHRQKKPLHSGNRKIIWDRNLASN